MLSFIAVLRQQHSGLKRHEQIVKELLHILSKHVKGDFQGHIRMSVVLICVEAHIIALSRFGPRGNPAGPVVDIQAAPVPAVYVY